MYFQHDPEIWRDFPELAAGVMRVDGIRPDVPVTDQTGRFLDIARGRLADGPESALPEIQAWRRAFTTMGLKPTQYRCASEALLRRFRKEAALPALHPVVDLCNAVSVAWAIPIAAIDVDAVDAGIIVRRATGDETYQTFGGEIEHPAPGEVIFADASGRAHARRWTNRQSGRSAVGDGTSRVLIVAEAMHDTASDDVSRLLATLVSEITTGWRVTPRSAMLTPARPRFED